MCFCFCHGILYFTYYWSVISKSIIVVSWISNSWPLLTHVKNLWINFGVRNSLWKLMGARSWKLYDEMPKMKNNIVSEICWNNKQQWLKSLFFLQFSLSSTVLPPCVNLYSLTRENSHHAPHSECKNLYIYTT